MPDGARDVIAAAAADRHAPLVDASRPVRLDSEMRQGRATVTIETSSARYGPVALGLRGEHQIDNALVAVHLLEAAASRTDVRLSPEAVERGLTEVSWPGRLELIHLPDDAQVLLDAAHNVDGARALAAYLERWHPERPALVIGMMRDKDAAGIAAALLPVVSSVVATAAETPRAIPARDLAARLTAAGAREVRAEPDPVTAVEQALSSARTVCVAGSIFLVGAVRDRLRRRAILR
jgi:dihydrofolate synthase/folylpolyglutamate synthase